MMLEVYLKLPFPPSANRIWRGTKGKVYLASEYKQFLNAVVYETLAQIGGGRSKCVFYDTVSVEVVLHPQNKRPYDIDNRIKPLLDSLTKAGIWKDDSQVKALCIREGEIVKKAFTEVTVRGIKNEQ